MLEYLRIRHLALIQDLELELAPGLNVITGETGAGKSFIMKALNFLTGDKLQADMVRPGAEKAAAEALFVLPPPMEAPGDQEAEEAVLRRELSEATGRSRLFVNDSLSSQETVKTLRPRLIVFAGQHGQQKLLQPAYQARILDGFLEDQEPLRHKDALLRRLRDLAARKDEILERRAALEDKREFLEFQQAEIAKVKPKPGEENELESRRRELKGAAEAEQSLSDALNLLHGADGSLSDALHRLEEAVGDLSRVLPDYGEDRSALAEMRIHLEDLESRLRRQSLTEGDGGEAELEKVEARLFSLAQLKRKLKRSLDEIVALKKEIEDNLSFLDTTNLDLKRLRKEEEALAGELGAVLERVNAARRAAGGALTAALETELRELGFSEDVRVICDFTPREVWPGLTEDRASFLWVPNPGQPPQPLDKIASGGELSRFLLAVIGLMAKAELPTLIFDEVDAGVGGETLIKVGEKLRSLSRRQQVICITHWPQLAALADRHFKVRKEVANGVTTTYCERLEGEAVPAELARMAGGGEQGKLMARELLGI